MREPVRVRRFWLALVGLVVLGGAAPAARADVKVPAIFGSHMVLQRDQANRVWGWADVGEKVTVSIAGQSHEATADGEGRWLVTLKPLSAGGPHTLTIAGKNKLELSDVLVGEVWICAGQSNMEWSVKQSTDPDLEIAGANFPNIRLITIPKNGTQEVQKDFKGEWSVCSPATVGDFSAVGYFFGRQINQTLGVPVGLVDNAWGGSACEAWIRRDLLAADPKYKGLMARWTDIETNIDKKVADWKVAAEKAKAEGKNPPQNPMNQLTGNARPANIYNGHIKPIVGYGIRGAIWYQGETNAGRAYQYRELFPLMIQSWRDEWAQGDFPFYWVQLADFMAEKAEPGESAWAELREAQTMTASRLKNSGQAVIIDIGEGKDIHPKNKLDVGKRLARLALADTYKVEGIIPRSPQYKSMEKQGNKIVLSFDNIAGGFRPFDVAEPKGFVIAGADKKWVPAKATIVGEKIEVSAEGVAEPVAVRYAWADNPICNLFSAASTLPLTPFRTDDWDGVTAKNE